MGLCGSSGGGGGGGGGGGNLLPEQRQDMAAAEPVFRALGCSKKDARGFLQVYEETLKNGQGQAHRALRYFRLDQKDYTYFYRTLGLFDAAGRRTFTFPQFVVLVWNFCSLDAAGLANWSFRVFFGGEGCEEHGTVSQAQVFHMLDVMYGISKEFDWHPNLTIADNSHDFDVNRSRKLVAKIAGGDGMVDRHEFVNLVRKTPALLMRIISAQKTMRDDCVGAGFWRRMEGQRQGMSIAKMTTRVEKETPGTLGSIRGGSGGGGSGGGGGGGGGDGKKRNKYAVKDAADGSAQSSRRRKNSGGSSSGKSRLDEEEDRAVMKMQAAMRAKKDRRAVRKKRAEQKAAKEKADLEALLAAAPSAREAAGPAAAANPNGDWVAAWDSTYKAEYYYNMATEECVWEKPPGFVSQ